MARNPSYKCTKVLKPNLLESLLDARAPILIHDLAERRGGWREGICHVSLFQKRHFVYFNIIGGKKVYPITFNILFFQKYILGLGSNLILLTLSLNTHLPPVTDCFTPSHSSSPPPPTHTTALLRRRVTRC